MVGGITLREDSLPIDLASSEGARFTLTRDPDTLLAKVDEASAVGRLMLKGLMSQRGAADFQTALASEVEEIKAERKKEVGAQAVLLFQTYLSLTTFISGVVLGLLKNKHRSNF